MKKRILLYLLLICAIPSYSQITVTRQDIGQIGDRMYYAFRDTFHTPLTVGNAGANQTWDYTAIAAQRNDSVLFLDPSTDPNAPAAANLMILIDGENLYIDLDSNSMEVITENAQSGLEVRYKWLDFPLTYQKNYTDSADIDVRGKGADFGAGIFDSVWIRVNGHTVSACDGWGTLKTPHKNYASLRVKTDTYNKIQLYVKVTPLDTSWTELLTQNDTEYVYRWYANNEKFYVAQANTDSNGIITSFAYKTDSVIPIQSVSEIHALQLAQIFPVPADNRLHIQSVTNSSMHVRIRDINGRFISDYTSKNGQQTIDVSGLDAGLYVCEISQNGNRIYRKIQIQH